LSYQESSFSITGQRLDDEKLVKHEKTSLGSKRMNGLEELKENKTEYVLLGK
jgi:hypothetical protein